MPARNARRSGYGALVHSGQSVRDGEAHRLFTARRDGSRRRCRRCDPVRQRGEFEIDRLVRAVHQLCRHGTGIAVGNVGGQVQLAPGEQAFAVVESPNRLSNHGIAGFVGHAGHPEVEGTMGQYDDSAGGGIYLVEDEEQVAGLQVKDVQRLSYVTQTTLSMDDTARVIDVLRERFPSIEGPKKNDICYATQNRQDAVKKLAADCDLMFVVGSPNSSNSNRLRELAERMGAQAYLLDGAADIDPAWLEGKSRIGVTAGASAPEVLVQEVIDGLRALGAKAPIEIVGQPENVTFSLPRELRIDVKNI